VTLLQASHFLKGAAKPSHSSNNIIENSSLLLQQSGLLPEISLVLGLIWDSRGKGKEESDRMSILGLLGIKISLN